MTVRTAGRQKHRIGMPRDGGYSAADGLLNVLGDPPVILLFEIADSDCTGTAADGEFGLGW